MEQPIETTPKKRGRKPLGEQAMTAAEAKRRSRAKKAAEGRAEFMVSISGGKLKFIDQLAEASGNTRSGVIDALLDMAIAKMANAVAQADHMLASGASEQEIETRLMQALRTAPPTHLVDKYKEVVGIK